MKTASL
jgi:ATP-dependent RNA helicase RhlE